MMIKHKYFWRKNLVNDFTLQPEVSVNQSIFKHFDNDMPFVNRHFVQNLFLHGKIEHVLSGTFSVLHEKCHVSSFMDMSNDFYCRRSSI